MASETHPTTDTTEQETGATETEQPTPAESTAPETGTRQATPTPRDLAETKPAETGARSDRDEVARWKAQSRKNEEQAKANHERGQQLEAENAALKAENAALKLRAEVSAATGVPLALLSGDDKAAIEASAQVALTFRGEHPKPPAVPSAESLGKTGDKVGGPSQVTSRDDLKTMSPEQINQARKEGRLNDLLVGNPST